MRFGKKSMDFNFGWVIAFVVFIQITLSLAILGAIGFVVWHFVSKYW